MVIHRDFIFVHANIVDFTCELMNRVYFFCLVFYDFLLLLLNVIFIKFIQ